MTGTLIELLIAAIVFAGSHFGIASTWVRDDLPEPPVAEGTPLRTGRLRGTES